MKIDVLKMIDELRRNDVAATLAIIQVGDNPASNLYVKSKKKELEKWNITVRHEHFEEDVEPQHLIYKIIDLNSDNNVNGIILQLPLPDHLKEYEQYLIDCIDPRKNVDGFKQSGGGESFYTPCTPKGIMHILKKTRDIKGKVVCLIGRGKTVGGPLIDILSKEPCTLICCNSNTDRETLNGMLRMSDIVITAVGIPKFFNDLNLKADALVIDAGISYVDGKQTGDFDNKSCWINSSVDYTPHIGGVGKMTVCMLAMNTIQAKLQQDEYLREE